VFTIMTHTRRKTGYKEQRGIFVIATDGTKTEPRYFDQFKKSNKITIKIIYHANIPKVLRELNNYCRDNTVTPKTDNVWLVIDKDEKESTELTQIANKCRNKEYNLAVSNPCFEYWLYLHHAEHRPFLTTDSCTKTLNQKLGTYDKSNYDVALFTPYIDSAIERAQRNDSGNSHPWPKDTGTHVYKLVKKLPKI